MSKNNFVHLITTTIAIAMDVILTTLLIIISYVFHRKLVRKLCCEKQ